MSARRQVHETRSARARRDFWKRVGVWIFIGVFTLGVTGSIIGLVFLLTSRPQ